MSSAISTGAPRKGWTSDFSSPTRPGQTLQANRAFRKIVGEHPSGEPRSLEEAFSTEPQAAECLFRLLRAIERGEPRQEEFRFRGQDGRSRTSRWLRVTVRPMPAALGGGENQPTILWQIADITQEHARVAETLRTLETRLAHFDGLPFGLLELDADGRVSEINPTLAGWLAREVPVDPEHAVHLSEILAPGAEASLRLSLAAAEGQWARDRDRPDAGRGRVCPGRGRCGSAG